MKKIFYALAVVTLIFSTVSCTNDDNTPTTVITPETPTEKQLLTGKWKMIKGEIYFNGDLFQTQDLKSESCDYDFYELFENGVKNEVYHDSEADCVQDAIPGTWSYNATSKLVTLIDDEDGYELLAEVIEINTTSLKIKLISDGGDAFPEGFEVFMFLNK